MFVVSMPRSSLQATDASVTEALRNAELHTQTGIFKAESDSDHDIM